MGGVGRNPASWYPEESGSYAPATAWPLLPILGDDYLLIEFVSQIPILVIEHEAAAREYEVGHDPALR